MITFVYIDNQHDLESYCKGLVSSDLLSVDTEFVRERTFYPQPGLIQVSDGETISLIDPNACEDLKPFFALLESPLIRIVMHSASEDIELFDYMGCGTIKNLFDTQLAASWLNMGQSLSLQKLVEHYENVVLEKQLTRTNWLKRPLSDAQLQYAAADVLYLNNICQLQAESLEKLGFLDSMKEDCDLRCEKKATVIADSLAYLKVKKAITATGDALGRLQRLSEWREQQSRQDNKPRQHLIKDQQLLSICLESPQNLDELKNNCELSEYLIRRYGEKIIGVVSNNGIKQPTINPVLSLRSIPEANQTIKDCRKLMDTIHEQQNIPREVLPSKRWIEQFLKHQVASWYPEAEGWNGWRKSLLQEPLEQIIDNNNFELKIKI